MNKLPLFGLMYCLSFTIHADVSSDVKDMLSTAATRNGGSLTFTNPSSISAGDVAGLNRNALDMGGLRLRTPVKSFNIANLTAPNISAGCNGIDITLGSFSFLSKDELIAMMRSIASNALTYAFGQAIKSMCEGCWTSITSLQAKMQDLNQMFRNTCATAKCLYESVAEKSGCASKAIDDLGCMYSTGWAKVDDYSACKDKSAKETAADLKNTETANESVGFIFGNQTYSLIQEVLTDNPNDTLEDLIKLLDISGVTGEQLILSILGTFIRKDEEEPKYYKPTLTMKNLLEDSKTNVDPSSLKIKYYKCGAEEVVQSGVTFKCLNLIEEDFALGKKNIDEIVEESLIRIQDAAFATPHTLNSLTPIDKYMVNFIDNIIFRAMFYGHSSDGDMAKKYLRTMGDFITTKIKHDVSSALLRYTRQLMNDSQKSKHIRANAEGYLKTIDAINEEQEKYASLHIKAIERLNKDKNWFELREKFSKDVKKVMTGLSGG